MKPASMFVALILATACAHQGPTRDPNGRPAVHVDLFRQGQELTQAGDYVRAEQYFAGALQTGGDVDVILPSLLRVCIASERYEAALAYAERYEPSARDSVEVELVLAALQMAVGQVDAARRSLELVLAVKDDPQAHFMLGDLYYHQLQDYGSADTHYRKYLALAPTGKHAVHVKRLLLKRPTARPLLEVEDKTGDDTTPVLDAPAAELSAPEAETDDHTMPVRIEVAP